MPTLQSILVDGINALLVEPDSADALCGAIEKLATNASLANRLGQKALEDVRKFAWEKGARTIIDRCGG